MADRTILLAQNKRHATRGLSVINPQEFLAFAEDDDNLTYIVDMGAYLDGATIVLVTRTPTGVVISNASNTTTRLTQRLAGYGHVDFRVQTSAGDTEQFRVYIQPRAANPAFFLTAGSGGGITALDGDKGDVIVSSAGSTWTLDPTAVASLNIFTDTLKGITPASGGGTTNFLRADGTWATPPAATDNDYGDITVSSSGTVWTIDNNAVTLAKMADMATSSLIYRKTAGSGAPEVNTLATLKTDLGLTGTNSGDQTITLTGDVTGSGTGSFVTAIGAGVIVDADVNASAAIAYSKLASMTGGSVLLGNASNVPTVTALSGDVTVSNAGVTAIGAGVIVTADIANSQVTYAKVQNVSATDRVLGRSTAGAGVVEEIICTAAGRALIDDADAAAQRSTLGINISVSVESYHTSGGGANSTWQAALDTAVAAVSAAGGGEVTCYRDVTYTFTGYPAAIPAGVLIRGRPSITRFVLPSTGGSLLQFTGSLGTSYTLNSNTAIGANTISLLTNTSLAVGDLLRITRTPPAPITLGTWTQIVEVESITGAGPYTVTIRGRAKFAVATTDTYTINRMVPHVGGGCVGIIFDGSNCNDTTTRTCQGIRALYTRNLHIDDIGGEDMDGQDPTNASTAASVLRMDGCYDTRGLQNLWAIRSGCTSVCDLQFTGSNGHFGNITSRDASGFGPGWYNCFDVHVNSITSQFAQARAGKMQCTLDFTLNSVISDQPGFTGFGFTEGSKGLVRSAIYNPSRNTSPTQPSFWCNNTGVEIAVGQIRLAQATNTNGDIHTGTNDKVWIYDVVTDNFTPTYAGAAGSSANGTGRNIARVDGVRLFEAQSQFPDGTAGAPSVTNVGDLDTGIYWSADNTLAITTAGSRRFEVNNNGRVGIPAANNSALFYLTATAQNPAQFWFDNFYYVTFGSNAATNGKTGFQFIAKNGSGTDYYSLVTAEAGNLTFQGPNTGVILFGQGDAVTGGALIERMRIDGNGNVIVNTAAIATNATNGFLYVPTCAGTPTGTPTTYSGRAPIVVDTTANKLYFYSGGAWRDAGP